MGFGKDGKGVILRQSLTATIGTLAAATGLIIGTALAIDTDFRMLKAEILATITGVTAGELNALALYLVDGDFTLAEFEASLESNGPVGPNDSVNAALAERWTKFCGAVVHSDVSTALIFTDRDSGGSLLKIMPRWTFQRVKSWNWILYNAGEAPTTGATMRLKAKCFGVWVR